MKEVLHWIDGAFEESRSAARFESVNPYSKTSWASVALGGRDDVLSATRSARAAFDDGPWPRMGTSERGRLLHRLADALAENAEEFAEADTYDMGKPISQSMGADVPRSVANLRFFADLAASAVAERFPMDSGHHAYTRYEPAGVVAAIAPWNFPLMQATWKVAPALAWGNTVVLKPAETSPTSATMLAALATEVGIPDGVLNVVQGFGPDSAGQFLTESPLIDRITFTGETSTGRSIAAAAAANLTPVSLELGGKGATIVFDDADLTTAAEWAARAIFSNSGQICLCGSRIYVQERCYESFVERLVELAEAILLGDPREPSTEMGPLASFEHYEKVAGFLEDLPAGAYVATGGLVDDAWAVRPTVILGAPHDARLFVEEIFGPIAPIIPFRNEDEAVQLANDTKYGLSAMVFTDDLNRAHRVSAKLNSGNVWVNCFYVRDLRSPFGGFKDSGIGREGGLHSREFFTEPKSVVMAIKEQP
ncbi:aldehyde dehydrogenase [Gemmatimonas sp.]|uniref:aldehyde dehydrogenase n=1 Tax=Gemmatimonas sp. TaxID=1962908 RepID=UPI003568D9C6